MAGRAGPKIGRVADCGRQDGNARGQKRERSCRRKKRAGGCRNADRRMQKTQAGRRSALGGATMKTQEGRLGSARLGSARLGLIVAMSAPPPVNPETGSRPMSRLDAAVPVLAIIGVMTCPSDTDLFRNAIQDCGRFCHNSAANGILPMPPGSEHDGADAFPETSLAASRDCRASASMHDTAGVNRCGDISAEPRHRRPAPPACLNDGRLRYAGVSAVRCPDVRPASEREVPTIPTGIGGRSVHAPPCAMG